MAWARHVHSSSSSSSIRSAVGNRVWSGVGMGPCTCQVLCARAYMDMRRYMDGCVHGDIDNAQNGRLHAS